MRLILIGVLCELCFEDLNKTTKNFKKRERLKNRKFATSYELFRSKFVYWNLKKTEKVSELRHFLEKKKFVQNNKNNSFQIN